MAFFASHKNPEFECLYFIVQRFAQLDLPSGEKTVLNQAWIGNSDKKSEI